MRANQAIRITRTRPLRRGSVYLAVLGTAMIAGVLAFSALALQRVQNRMLGSASDVQQAQLNAEAAIQMGLLTVKNDATWRTSNPHGDWFVDRNLGAGTSSLAVVDPLDASLADSATEPIEMTGVGAAGLAVQRVTRTIDSYPQPLECLRSAIAAGGDIALSGCTLRASNSGLITANSISASGSNVYGRVQALTVSGGTYQETTTQVTPADRPTMPNWSTVFDYYQDNGTEIPIGSISSNMGSFVRNNSFTTDTSYWTGTPNGGPTATITRSNAFGTFRTAGGGLRVSLRSAWNAGAAQPIDSFIKAGQPLTISGYINHTGIGAVRNFRVRIVTKGSGSSEATASSADIGVLGVVVTFLPISATVTAPAWTGDLEYAYAIISGGTGNTSDFYLDDVGIQDASSGRFIYREVLGPGVNTVNGAVNPQGLYWINCMNNRIVIERSRIKGTLLLINPGAGSMIGPGPISWTPNSPGYPCLLVDADTPTNADFTIAATNRTLNEAEDGTNYNPAGAIHSTFGTDTDINDTYPAEIQGVIVVRDDLTFQNNGLVRGSVIVGDQVAATSGSLDVDFRPDALYSPPPGLEDNPQQVPRPLSIRKVVGP